MLLSALVEVLDRTGQGADISLDDLVFEASTQAQRQQTGFLEHGLARKRYWELFQALAVARLGRAIKGRKGHASRFSSFHRTELERALDDLGVAPEQTEDGAKDLKAAPKPRLRRDEVIARLREHRLDVKRFGVSALSLFGSVARDEAGPDSDVDLVVTFEAPVTSENFFGVKFLLEDLLGRRVDLVTDSALRESLRSAIEAELISVA